MSGSILEHGPEQSSDDTMNCTEDTLSSGEHLKSNSTHTPSNIGLSVGSLFQNYPMSTHNIPQPVILCM